MFNLLLKMMKVGVVRHSGVGGDDADRCGNPAFYPENRSADSDRIVNIFTVGYGNSHLPYCFQFGSQGAAADLRKRFRPVQNIVQIIIDIFRLLVSQEYFADRAAVERSISYPNSSTTFRWLGPSILSRTSPLSPT